MPSYLIIQLILLITALILGIYNAWIGMSKAGMWTFPKRRHSTLGYIFFTIILISFILTLLYLPSLKAKRIKIPGYSGLTWFIFILSIIGVILGIIRNRTTGSISTLRRLETTISALHPWPLILATGILFAQVFNLLSRIFSPPR